MPNARVANRSNQAVDLGDKLVPRVRQILCDSTLAVALIALRSIVTAMSIHATSMVDTPVMTCNAVTAVI